MEGSSVEDKMASLAQHMDSDDDAPLLLTNQAQSGGQLVLAKGGGGRKQRGKRKRVSAESLPENYHSLSLRQLKAVCAAHGLKVSDCDSNGVGIFFETVWWRGSSYVICVSICAEQ